MWLRTLLVVCALTDVASAQAVVFSGVGAQASPGGGSRSVLLVGGQYLVFFSTGSSVVYSASRDAVTFSVPQSASTTPANLGFSVARHADTLGLVWANNDATGYSLWYREAAISGATLSFGAPTLVASHPTDTRGYLATLSYSAAGTPYIAAFEYGQPYVGPVGPGCGAQGRYRPIHYLLQGTWMMRGYCNNFDTLRDPNSIAIAPSGQNMIVIAAIDANLSTAIVSNAGELGEPWHMVPAVDHLMPGQMSAAQSVTVATDVHTLYRDGAGAVSYGRQDGTVLDLNSMMLDVTVLNTAARHPALSRPTSAAGCYVAVYTVGNSIRSRTFTGAIGTLSAESTTYTTGSAPSNLSAELDAATAPALVWQEGSSIQLGFASAAVTLTATPPSAPADGTSVVAVSSTPFRDACGAPIAAGTPVTVTSSTGSIIEGDASANFDGTQVLADSAGRIAFRLTSTTGGSAVVAAMPVTGGTNARTDVAFTGGGGGGGGGGGAGCGDGVVDLAAGEECDSNGVDDATCNAATCQSPRCGDGYVNVAAAEQCESGSLCDPTTCTYTFIVGGGCAGCQSSRTDGMLLVFAAIAFALRLRRASRRST